MITATKNSTAVNIKKFYDIKILLKLYYNVISFNKKKLLHFAHHNAFNILKSQSAFYNPVIYV